MGIKQTSVKLIFVIEHNHHLTMGSAAQKQIVSVDEKRMREILINHQGCCRCLFSFALHYLLCLPAFIKHHIFMPVTLLTMFLEHENV